MPAPTAQIRRTEVLDDVLSRSVARGERTIDQVRIAAALMSIFTVVQSNWDYVVALAPRSVITLSGLVIGILLSLWSLQQKGPRSRSRLAMSIVLDALIITVAIVPTAIWARPDYPGQIHMPGMHFYGLAIVLAGLRLDRGLVRLAAALDLTLALGLVFLDLHINGIPPHLGMGDITLTVAIFLLWVMLGSSIAARTRNLVSEGAESVLQAERARQALGVYVSEEIATEVLDQEDRLAPGGSVREVAVLFSDLRGFTAWSDGLPPDRLVSELNGYLDAMVEVIRDEGGVVDKYIGDAIMVVFGLPEAHADDDARAVRCARRMQEALKAHNTVRVAHGSPPLRQGIGVHRGEVVAGNIGSADRLQYTVIGATVNLASRLESATKSEGVSVLVSEAVVDTLTKRRAPELDVLRPHGQLSVRGASEPVDVWTLTTGGADK